MKTTQRYTVDGVSYSSLEEMPPEVREKWNSVADTMTRLQDLATHTKWPKKPTTVRLERTVRTERFDWKDTLSSNPAIEMLKSLDGFARRDDAEERKLKRYSAVFTAVALPMVVLAMLPFSSGVYLTIHYTPAWYVAAAIALLTLAVCTWGLRDKLRARLYPNRPPTAMRIVGNVLAGLLGFGVMSINAVLGGVPIVAHSFISQPGELVVTVTGKKIGGGRYSCSRQLLIKEFTFYMRDHLCPGARGFDKSVAGSSLLLTGNVSRFGVSVDSWTVQ